MASRSGPIASIRRTAKTEFARLEQFLATEKNFRSDFRIVLDDGSVRHLQVFGGFYHDLDGRRHTVGVNWDITEDIRLREDIRHANARSPGEKPGAGARPESAAL